MTDVLAQNWTYVYTGTTHLLTDVRDPRNPKPVNFLPIHPNSWCMHLQTAEDLMLVIEELDPYLMSRVRAMGLAADDAGITHIGELTPGAIATRKPSSASAKV